MSSCCGQGMTNLMSQFKNTTASITNPSFTTQSTHSFKQNHPHNFTQTTTTQTTPQSFTSTFTKSGFMKFSRPTQ
jgi:hypothetical protein